MIAISYRREDSLPITGRLYDRLEAKFGKRNVFMDFDSIQPGLDFRQQIKETIERSKIVVAMIGANWVGEQDNGLRRIDDPADFVRLEIEYALKRGIPVIPVLINNTPMPKAEKLPSEIEELTFRHALPLDTGLDFRQHAERLIAAICDSIAATGEEKGVAVSSKHLQPKKSDAGAKQTKFLVWSAIIFVLAVSAGTLVMRLGGNRSHPAAQVPPEDHSIAVLPLVDLSETKDQEYLCDGFSEELLDSLAKVPGLRVVARTSAFSFKGKNVPVAEIANKLGVANIIEGSLRRDGSRIRVTTQLINARDGFHLWSDTFQRELRDVFAVQDEITHAIVDALKIRLVGSTSVRTGTENAEVYDLYLQGLYFSNKSGEQDFRKSLTLFQEALDKDPNFSRAWTGIAKAWLYLADAYVKPLEAYPIVASAAGNALQLNERDPEAHCFLGVAKQVLEWDRERMLKETQRALEIDPNSSLGHVWLGDTLRDRCEFDRALDEYQKAVRLDPLSPVVSDALCYGYVNAGRFDDAIAQGKHTLELDPNYVYLDSNLANAYREKGLLDQAIVVYHASEQSTHSPSAGLAIAYARLGKIKEAEQKLAELLAQKDRQYISASNIALVYAALGKKDEAFAWLERAYSEHDSVVSVIASNPGSQPLRRDPRFIDLVKRVGLDPTKAIPHEVQH